MLKCSVASVIGPAIRYGLLDIGYIGQNVSISYWQYSRVYTTNKKIIMPVKLSKYVLRGRKFEQSFIELVIGISRYLLSHIGH